MHLNDYQRVLLEILKRPEVGNPEYLRKLYQRLRTDTLKKISEDNWIDLTIAYHLLSSPNVPEQDRNLWQSVYNSYTDSDLVVWKWLNNVILKLSESGHEILLLKDTGLSLCVYPTRLYRRYKDVDILVLPESYEQLERLLEPLGFQINFDDSYRRPPKYLSLVNAQKEFVLDVGDVHLKFEFHLRPHAGKWVRPEQEPAPKVLFQNSLRIQVENGVTVRVMDYENNLLHECIHVAKHFFVLDKAVRMYVDIDRLIASGKVDWDAFIRLVHDYRVLLPVRIALRLTKEFLSTDVPDYVFAALPAVPWRERMITRWVYRLGIFEPSEHKLSRAQRYLFYGVLADSWGNSLCILQRTFLPPVEHMKLRYGFSSNLLAPVFYLLNAFRVVVLRRL